MELERDVIKAASATAHAGPYTPTEPALSPGRPSSEAAANHEGPQSLRARPRGPPCRGPPGPKPQTPVFTVSTCSLLRKDNRREPSSRQTPLLLPRAPRTIPCCQRPCHLALGGLGASGNAWPLCLGRGAVGQERPLSPAPRHRGPTWPCRKENFSPGD